ncbi:MAG: molybdopterin molybdotransferase MoeA [Candidatus Dormibacter sp.]|uniref:molybdopterin molybdotransferase MoeA n=1 Tax=Candidatus Dormibacter sp. TaxID=2973982 RepID=UPI000DB520C8|nr:MAG: molybdopterin molybdenumtransferase MoeA [Candidatus Dormibacteraeota bacterium]
MQPSTYPLIDPDQALALVLQEVAVLGTEELPLAACPNRVLAQDLIAEQDLPPFRSSAVDGYALRAADSGGRLPLAGEAAAGRPFQGSLPQAAAARILTGGVLPEGADTVVMLEEVRAGADWVEVPAGLRPGSNYHRPGADLTTGTRVLRRGDVLGPAELGLAAALNRPSLIVHRRPRVALMSTGDELVQVGGRPEGGQIIDSNRWALLAALGEAGAEVSLLPAAPDDPAQLRQLVLGALIEHEVLVTSGGVSVGSHDLVKPLLESLGKVHIGRVKLKPGKPFTFATLSEDRVAFGLPGFPVSSLVTFEVFVRPALRRMQGFRQLQRPRLPVRLDFEAKPAAGRTEYHRVSLRRRGDELIAQTTGSQSSSRLLSLVGAHALVRIPSGDEPVRRGSQVEALILNLPAD